MPQGKRSNSLHKEALEGASTICPLLASLDQFKRCFVMLQYLVLLNEFISYHCTEITDESQCNSNEETQIGCAEGHPIYIVKLVANS